MNFVDPFQRLSEEILGLMSKDRKREYKAAKNFDEIVSQYRSLLEDTRYTKIKQQIVSDLATELRLLVDEASKVSETASRAHKIKVLDQLIADPLEALWLNEQQLNMASDVD